MTGDTTRKERTLPARTAVPGDPETTPEPGDVVSLSDAGRDAAHVETEPDSGNDGRPEQRVEEASAGAGAPFTTDSGKGRGTGFPRTVLKIIVWTAAFPVLAILPFLVVLRISVLAYQENTNDGWQALVVGILAALLLVCAYIAVFMWTFDLRRRLFMPLLNACLTVMLCYSGFALFHLAVSNAKTAEIRSYYTSLHPFLRVAVKNLTIIDEDLVLTDVQRTRADYSAMGLPAREYSLHFRQPSGFVHAVDIRTAGRPKVTNLLVELYFIMMGFQTIRHVGTADHLHVALPLTD